MDEFGFKPYKPKMKKKYDKVIKKDIGSFSEIIKDLEELKKEDVELQGTRNNKLYKESMDILKNEKLMRLSSMNNYFIFQKV